MPDRSKGNESAVPRRCVPRRDPANDQIAGRVQGPPLQGQRVSQQQPAHHAWSSCSPLSASSEGGAPRRRISVRLRITPAPASPCFSVVLLIGHFRRRRDCWALAFYIVSIPIQVTLVAISDERWSPEFVILAGIDYQQRRHS